MTTCATTAMRGLVTEVDCNCTFSWGAEIGIEGGYICTKSGILRGGRRKLIDS